MDSLTKLLSLDWLIHILSVPNDVWDASLIENHFALCKPAPHEVSSTLVIARLLAQLLQFAFKVSDLTLLLLHFRLVLFGDFLEELIAV